MATRKLAPLLVIVGETASGKSALAMSLAKKFNGELICADSWTVYKGFNIGTAKPSLKDQQEIPHHMLDIADPEVGFSAAEFKRQAEAIIIDILKRGKLPIVVGGTGLYIDSLIYDYSFLPASSEAVRNQYNSKTLSELQSMVKAAGYDSGNVDLNNKRRVIRLLENRGEKPKSGPMLPNILMIGLQTDSQKLKENVEKRVELMFENGLENEVRALAKTYGWEAEPMKGVGYREFKNYFDGKLNINELKNLIINNTLKLAKKQRTWFKRNNSIQWHTNGDNIVHIVTTYLNKLSV